MSGGSIHEKWERCNLTASRGGGRGGRGGEERRRGDGEEQRGEERREEGREEEEKPTVMSLLSESVVIEETKGLHLRRLDRRAPESHSRLFRSFQPFLKIILKKKKNEVHRR